jgi:hypothetical protein
MSLPFQDDEHDAISDEGHDQEIVDTPSFRRVA